jgi:choline kinase
VRGVILAAGSGTRLTGSGVVRPKCLAPFGEHALIDLQLRAFRASSIDDVTVVLGFEADQVRRACGPGVRFVENSLFAQTNSLYSLWLARPLLADGFVAMNCDVLFHPALLGDLLTSKHDSALLVSYPEAGDPAFGDEEMRVQVRRGRVVGIAKDLPDDETDGENVGIAKFTSASARRLIAVMDRIVGAGHMREWAPRAFAEFAQEAPLFAIGTRGLPWTEIDTPEDYQFASRRIFPAIQRDARAAQVWNTASHIAPALRRGA